MTKLKSVLVANC